MHQSEMHDHITYLYFCTLGGILNPRCYQVLRWNGSYSYFTYHLRDFI